jgi:predicted RNase H-like nuclease
MRIIDASHQVAIDMPIGLSRDGPRDADIAARTYLGAPRASSVFPAPCRPTLAATSYTSACRLNRAACGSAVTIYLYNLLPRIRVLDALMTPERQAVVRECHPEVAFAIVDGRERGLVHSKKSAEGQAERMAILRHHLPPFDPEAERMALGRANVAIDDLLDAAICLVTAARIARGIARTFPVDPPLDDHGLRMEILA